MNILETIVDYLENPAKYVGEFRWNEYRDVFEADRKPLSEVLAGDKFGRKLGAGNFSQVFDLGNGRVAKVDMNNRDAAYNCFAEYCMNTPSLHLPKIYEIIRVNTGNYIYVMEKLTKLCKADANILVSAIQEGRYPNGDEETEVSKPLSFKIPNFQSVIDIVKTLDKYREAVNNEAYLGEYLSDDLHSRNVMVRDTVPIITDPWC